MDRPRVWAVVQTTPDLVQRAARSLDAAEFVVRAAWWRWNHASVAAEIDQAMQLVDWALENWRDLVRRLRASGLVVVPSTDVVEIDETWRGAA